MCAAPYPVLLVALAAIACSSAGTSSSQAGDGGLDSGGTAGQAGAAGSAGSGTSGGSGAGAGGDAGTGGTGATGGECERDSDCKLLSDCCKCEAIPADQPLDLCEAACGVTPCESAGAQGVRCLVGRCELVKRCRAEAAPPCPDPPPCPAGTLPVAGPIAGSQCMGIPWTGECSPVERCDWVPDCNACPDGTHCIVLNFGSSMGTGSTRYECRPAPAACASTIDCACASELCEFGGQCQDRAEGGIVCNIPGS